MKDVYTLCWGQQYQNNNNYKILFAQVLQQQINDLNAMINAEDVFGLMFRLRGSLSRNQHGMLHEGLFSRAHAGTKARKQNTTEGNMQTCKPFDCRDGRRWRGGGQGGGRCS